MPLRDFTHALAVDKGWLTPAEIEALRRRKPAPLSPAERDAERAKIREFVRTKRAKEREARRRASKPA